MNGFSVNRIGRYRLQERNRQPIKGEFRRFRMRRRGFPTELSDSIYQRGVKPARLSVVD